MVISGCAKQSSPMGGPIDEDPPQLLSLTPENQSINSKPETIILEFDEYLKLDNPNKNIIITPRLNKNEIITTALKNRVIIELNQELEDSTTYVFNFQKSVQDLSEGNPAENLKLVFSTGPTIDSLTVNGKTNILFPTRTTDYKDVLVGLYELSDTTDLFTSPPYYISRADSIGNFAFENLRAGQYLAYSWLDENNTLKAEYKSEMFSFINDTLELSPDQNSFLYFNLSAADQTAFKLSRSSNSGSNLLIVFNKGLKNFELQAENSGKEIFYKILDDRVRVYSEPIPNDSLALKIIATDSINQSIDTLIWAKFPESERKPEDLSITVNSGISFFEELKMELTFNKPLKEINYDSLLVSYDSALFYPVTPSMVSFKDSIRRDELLIQLTIPDSLNQSIFSLIANDSTFQDIEGLYNDDLLKANYRKLKRNSLADEISGSVNTQASNVIVELQNGKDETIRSTPLNSDGTFSFKLIEPGTYRLKVIEDENGNGIWDPADYNLKRQAEKVYYFFDPETASKDIMIRGGWSVGPLQISPNPDTGIR